MTLRLTSLSDFGNSTRRRAVVLALAAIGATSMATPMAFAGDEFSIGMAVKVKLSNGQPVADPVDIKVEIFSGPSGGNAIDSDTFFDVELDESGFSSGYPEFNPGTFRTQQQRWAQISIRYPAGSTNEFQVLQPRQRIAFNPRSLMAQNLLTPFTGELDVNQLAPVAFLTHFGFGPAVKAKVDNQKSQSSAVEAETNGEGSAGEFKSVGQLPPGSDRAATVKIVQEDSNACALDVQGCSAFVGDVTINSGHTLNVDNVNAMSMSVNNSFNVDGLSSLTSRAPISTALGTLIVSNTNSTGRALLAFNQTGGEGMFGSSIGGVGCVGDGTGLTSIGQYCRTDVGRACVAQTLSGSTTNPTVQILNAGNGNALNIQHSPPGTGTIAVLVSTSPFNVGFQTTGRSVLAGPVSLGGVFTPSHPLHHTSGAHLSSVGVFTNASSRELKENFEPVAPRDVLARVAALPIHTWNYRADEQCTRHIGPTAEDFKAAFALGDGDRAIGTVDADGVALAAIQGLHELVIEKDRHIDELSDRVTALEAMVNRLAARAPAATD